LVGAYAALQGYHPLQFAFSHDINKRAESPKTIASNFDIIEQPAELGAWPAVAALFHRGDVRPSELQAYLRVEKSSVFEPGARMNAPRQLGLIARTGIAFNDGLSTAELEALRAKYVRGTLVTSSTGELRHDAVAGRFEVDTPRSQGFVGVKPTSPVVLTNVQIQLDSPFAVVLVTSLDDAPIASSKHFLVTALGNAVNTGMALASNRSRLADAGRAPILVEPIIGRVLFKNLSGSIQGAHAYALDSNGERMAEVQLGAKEGTLDLPMTAANQTMHYEITR
jgi:hypothetical protein